MPRTPPPFSVLRALFLRVSGSNPLQIVDNPTNDRFQNVSALYDVRIFPVSENGENGIGDEGVDGDSAPRIFRLEPPLLL